MKNLVISFSGGETSALMTDLLLREARDEYGAICVVFANTGQERNETLDFVRDCDEHFGFGTVWLEAVVHHNATRANTHRIVTYETAARLGGHGPFHDAIRKYGIPNQKFPGCTRDLKQNPIRSYIEGELGWADYDLAIGIRIDEIDRMRNRSEVIYPLVSRWI